MYFFRNLFQQQSCQIKIYWSASIHPSGVCSDCPTDCSQCFWDRHPDNSAWHALLLFEVWHLKGAVSAPSWNQSFISLLRYNLEVTWMLGRFAYTVCPLSSQSGVIDWWGQAIQSESRFCHIMSSWLSVWLTVHMEENKQLSCVVPKASLKGEQHFRHHHYH